jgi:hypothetical protein
MDLEDFYTRSGTTFGKILATLEESAASAALASCDDDERRRFLELRNQLNLHRAGEYIETLLDRSAPAMSVSEMLLHIINT